MAATGAAWNISKKLTKMEDKLDSMDGRLQNVENFIAANANVRWNTKHK